MRTGTATDDKKRIAELEKENQRLRRADQDPEAASAFFARNSTEAAALVEFIDAHRDRFGVEPACAVLEFAGVVVLPREGKGWSMNPSGAGDP